MWAHRSPLERTKRSGCIFLSGKLFCGHCGAKMNGNSNGNFGYAYYECYGKKNVRDGCTKKNLRKEFIEDVVVQDALALLTDENIETIADIAVRSNSQGIEEETKIPAIRGRLHETQVSLENIVRAIELGQAPELLLKRMQELEKDKRSLEAELKREEKDIVYLEKPQVIYWLEQFKAGDPKDEEFRRMIIDLFVNSVTVWDEDNDTFKITIAYNLSSLETKTYRLSKDGTSSIGFTLPTSKAGKSNKKTAACATVFCEFSFNPSNRPASAGGPGQDRDSAWPAPCAAQGNFPAGS